MHSPSRPAHILQVLPRLESGGVERGTLEIAEAIQKADMRAHVASSGGALVPILTRCGALHHAMPLHSKNPLIMWRNALRLRDYIEEHSIDIVHARSRAPAWSAYYACKWTGATFVTTFHGVYEITGKFKARYNSIMARGKKVIAVSKFVREHILRHYDAAPENVIRIDRGVDFKLFSPERIIPDRMAALTKEWRLPDEKISIILVPSRITRIKGQHIVLEALAKMQNKNFICVFLGNASDHEQYVKELEALMETLNLQGKLRIVPPTRFMAEAYALSDIVLMPSLKPEAFGRVGVEAQAMGKLVIATNHGGACETILPNETGYLVDVGDAEMLAAAIDFSLSRDAETKQAMSDFAIKHARANFSIARMKNATIRVYRDLLGENQNSFADEDSDAEDFAVADKKATELAYG